MTPLMKRATAAAKVVAGWSRAKQDYARRVMMTAEICGPPEVSLFTCGFCHKPIQTFWAPGHRGLLRGEYDLLGDVVFHRWCCDEYLKDFPK